MLLKMNISDSIPCVPPGDGRKRKGPRRWLPVEKLKEELAGKKDILLRVGARQRGKKKIYIRFFLKMFLGLQPGVFQAQARIILSGTALACGKMRPEAALS